MKTHTRRSRVRTLVLAAAALAVAGGGLVTATAAAPATAADGSLRVITHNLEKRDGALTRAIAEARKAPGPEVLLLQEVCHDMLARLKKERGWTVAWRARRTKHKCSGEDLGEVAVWTGGDAARSAVPLLTFGDQHYGLVCVRFTRAGQAVRACSTHLAAGTDPEDEAQRTQLTAEIDRVTRGWKEAVVVGGDFNSRPKATPLDSMYARGASSNGRFLEIHQIRTGEPRRGGLTTMYSTAKGRKSDYIFVVQGHTRLGGGTERVVRDSPSDHHILIGTFPLR